MRDLMFSQLSSEDPESQVCAVAFYDTLVTRGVPLTEGEIFFHEAAIIQIEGTVAMLADELAAQAGVESPTEDEMLDIISNIGLVTDDRDTSYRGIPTYQMFLNEVLDGAEVVAASMELNSVRTDSLIAQSPIALTPTTPVLSLNAKVAQLVADLRVLLREQARTQQVERANTRTIYGLAAAAARGKLTSLEEVDAFAEWLVQLTMVEPKATPFGYHYQWAGNAQRTDESVLWFQRMPALKYWIRTGGPTIPTDTAAMKACFKFVGYMLPATNRAHYDPPKRMSIMYAHGLNIPMAIDQDINVPINLLPFLLPPKELQEALERGRTIVRYRPEALRHELVTG